MAMLHHRLIYYAPTRSAIDARHCTLWLDESGDTRIDWAGLRLWVDPRVMEQFRPVRKSCPAPDAVILSRAMVREDLRNLPRRTPLVSMPAAVDKLDRLQFECVHPLDPWEWIVLRKGDVSITITAVYGGDREAMGTVLELRPRPEAEPLRLYLAGGCLPETAPEDLDERLPCIDVTVRRPGRRWRDGGLSGIARNRVIDRCGRHRIQVTECARACAAATRPLVAMVAPVESWDSVSATMEVPSILVHSASTRSHTPASDAAVTRAHRASS